LLRGKNLAFCSASFPLITVFIGENKLHLWKRKQKYPYLEKAKLVRTKPRLQQLLVAHPKVMHRFVVHQAKCLKTTAVHVVPNLVMVRLVAINSKIASAIFVQCPHIELGMGELRTYFNEYGWGNLFGADVLVSLR
jgi:hypothetical protein